MSMQILDQSQPRSALCQSIVEIMRNNNFSLEDRQNLSADLAKLEEDICSGKVVLTGDKEFFRSFYGTWESEDYISDALKVFFYFIYFIIFMIGLSGNILVCYVFISNKSMHSVTNLFITNLAISDILLCLFAVPFTPLYLLTFREWIFGTLMCHSVPYVQGVSVYISAMTLMAIAIDRFFVIIYPFKARMKMYVCSLIIIAIWILAAALTLPYGLYVRIIESPYTNDTYLCDEVWPSEAQRKAFGITTTMMQFVIPVIIISFCYIRVCGKLSDKTRTIPGAKSARKEELERERTSRTNRMLISMVIVFGISWMPLNGYNLLLDFHMQAARWSYSRALFLLAHAIAMSSTCYNPLLYAWLNENFRKEFKAVLPCWRSVTQSAVANSSRRENSSIRNFANNRWKEHNGSQRSAMKEIINERKMSENKNGSKEEIEMNEELNANVSANGELINRDNDCLLLNPTEKTTTVRYMTNSDSVVLQITDQESQLIL